MINREIKNNNKGFTLVEMLVAVFILTISITSFMNVASSGLFAAKYARDEITSNYLLQEAVDYIRNDRDNFVFLQSGVETDVAWEKFLEKYKVCSDDSRGCFIDVLNGQDAGPQICNNKGSLISLGIEGQVDSGCPYLYYDSAATKNTFYNYDQGIDKAVKTNFKRKIFLTRNENNLDEIDVIVTVSWKNGGLDKTRTLKTSLLKWQ